jgi:hypothetical protein
MRISFCGLVTLLLAASLLAQQQPSEPGDIHRVLLVAANQTFPMRDNIASSRSSWQVVISKQLFTFPGPRAALRTTTTLPEFQFDKDPAFDDPVYLFRFDRHSDRREIRVAKSSGGLTEMSIPKDHLIETRTEETGDGDNSNRRYRLKPLAPLRPGEYCLSRKISTCYDFGVDP